MQSDRKSDDELFDVSLEEELKSEEEYEYIVESEQEPEQGELPSLSDDNEITCRDIIKPVFFLLSLAISFPTIIHVLPAIFYPNKTIDTNTTNYKSLVKFEISYELILLVMGLYFTHPVWMKYLKNYLYENSLLQSVSLFRRSSTLVSFGKQKQDVEANDVMNEKFDCEMQSTLFLSKNNCKINSKTPLKDDSRTAIYYSGNRSQV